jgi:hypothetical protein
MRWKHLAAVTAALSFAGCAANTNGPNGADEGRPAIATSAAATAPAPEAGPATVTVLSAVTATNAAGLDGVAVLRIPNDAYITPVLRTQTDAAGAYALDGVASDAREWFYFEQPGYAGLFQAFDTTAAAQQALPVVTLLSNAEASALAQANGETIDPSDAVIRVPFTVAGGDVATDSPADGVQVTFDPPLATAVHYAGGEAIVFNAGVYESYRVTVRRNGRLCAPAAHPALVAADGSFEVRTMTGLWSVAPTSVCE